MNSNFYQNPTFPNNNIQMNNQNFSHNNHSDDYKNEKEMSYIENILRANKGKTVKAFFSYPDSEISKDKEYFGTIEEAGVDHIVLRDSSNGSFYLLRMVYLNYFEFMEPIDYKK